MCASVVVLADVLEIPPYGGARWLLSLSLRLTQIDLWMDGLN